MFTSQKRKEVNRMKRTNQQTLAEFPTRDIYLATVIKQTGIPILRVEGNGRQGIFVFKASDKIDGLITRYFNGELRVDPRILFETWKALKAMAFSTIQNVR